MKRWIPFTAVCLVLCFLIGAQTGSTTQADHMATTEAAAANTQTTVAVINSDTSVMVDGVSVNYSSAVIDALGDEFVLVSPAMADTGFENGSYGAVITFPSDVSQKVLSFNSSQPEKVQIGFKVNPNLSGEDYLDTYMRIVSLEMSMNTTLAGTYVSSIFTQVHLAQDEVTKVFQNDQSDLSALGDVNLTDFTTQVNWDEPPEIKLDVTTADTSAFYQQVVSFADTVSTLYLDSYDQASSQYLGMRTGLYRLTDDLPRQRDDWLDLTSAWSDNLIDYTQKVEQFAADVEANQTELQRWYQQVADWSDAVAQYQFGVITWHHNVQEWFGKAQDWYVGYQQYLTDATKFADDNADYREQLNNFLSSLQTWETDLNGYRTDLANWAQSLSQKQTDLDKAAASIASLRTSIEGLPPIPDPDADEYRANPAAYQVAMKAWYDALHALAAGLPDLATLSTTTGVGDKAPEFAYDGRLAPDLKLDLSTSATDLLPPQLDAPGSDPNLKAPAPVDKLSLTNPDQLRMPPTDPPPVPENFWIGLNQLHDQLASFSVEDYLSDEVKHQVAVALSGYEHDLNAVRDDLSNQFQGNVMKLLDAQSTYDAYLSALRSQALQTEATEQDNLRQVLKEYTRIKTANSENTKERLERFANMMSESRSPAGTNRDLVGFTVNPVEFTAPEMNPGETHVIQVSVINTYQTAMQITAWVLAGLGLITLLSYIWTSRSRKRREVATAAGIY